MKLLLDSHILVAIALRRLPEVSAAADRLLRRPDVEAWASVASLWEIAIKTRFGKLDPGLPLEELPSYFDSVGLKVLPIVADHALATVAPLPSTRDPFDRILLAQCSVEELRLVTLDEALRNHPLAARHARGHPPHGKSEKPPVAAPLRATAARESGATSASRSAA